MIYGYAGNKKPPGITRRFFYLTLAIFIGVFDRCQAIQADNIIADFIDARLVGFQFEQNRYG